MPCHDDPAPGCRRRRGCAARARRARAAAPALAAPHSWCTTDRFGARTWPGGQITYNNEWNSGSPQRMCANGPGNVRVIARQSATGRARSCPVVLSYPAVQYNLPAPAGQPIPGTPIGKLREVRSTYAESQPGYPKAIGEFASDDWWWVASQRGQEAYEVMSWEDNQGQSPGGTEWTGHAGHPKVITLVRPLLPTVGRRDAARPGAARLLRVPADHPGRPGAARHVRVRAAPGRGPLADRPRADGPRSDIRPGGDRLGDLHRPARRRDLPDNRQPADRQEAGRAVIPETMIQGPRDSPADSRCKEVLPHTCLIEETARHLGHLDLLRELADGQTGEEPAPASQT